MSKVSRRLVKELEMVAAVPDSEWEHRGFRLRPLQGADGDLSLYELEIWRFDANPTLDLCLRSYEMDAPAGARAVLRFEIRLPQKFPLVAPAVRLVWPRVLAPSVSTVDSVGRMPSISELVAWTPAYVLTNVAEFVRDALAAEAEPTLLWAAPPYSPQEVAAADNGVYGVFRALPSSCLLSQSLASSGKIVMPSSVLNRILILNQLGKIELKDKPILFRVGSLSGPLSVHATVSEFVEQEQLETAIDAGVYFTLGVNHHRLPEIFLPDWMFQHLSLDSELLVSVCSVDLPKATYVRFRPLDNAFFDRYRNTRSVLMTALGSYVTLTQGTTIQLAFGEHSYLFDVLELRPETAVDIQDTDFEAEFERWYIEAPQPAAFEPASDAAALAAFPTAAPAAAAAVAAAAAPMGYSLDGGAGSSAVAAPAAAAAVAPTAAGMEECANCGKRVPTRAMATHATFCARNTTRCDVCGAAIPISERDEHVAKFHAAIACPECGLEGIDPDVLPFHLESECARRIVSCAYCESAFSATEIDAHEKYCGDRTEHCPRCNQYVRMRLMVNHVQTCGAIAAAAAAAAAAPAPRPQPGGDADAAVGGGGVASTVGSALSGMFRGLFGW